MARGLCSCKVSPSWEDGARARVYTFKKERKTNMPSKYKLNTQFNDILMNEIFLKNIL